MNDPNAKIIKIRIFKIKPFGGHHAIRIEGRDISKGSCDKRGKYLCNNLRLRKRMNQLKIE
jgi:hypothetical protein